MTIKSCGLSDREVAEATMMFATEELMNGYVKLTPVDGDMTEQFGQDCADLQPFVGQFNDEWQVYAYVERDGFVQGVIAFTDWQG